MPNASYTNRWQPFKMTRTVLTILSALLTLTALCQSYSRCEIVQYGGEDSSKAKTTKVITYDKQGRVTSETYNGFKESSSIGTSDVTHFYYYRDSLLSRRGSIYPSGDSSKIIYEYDKRGFLNREIHSDFEKRIRNDVDKGLGRPGGCIITEEDYEKERTWKKTSIINFTYDKQGNKLEYYAPKIHWGSQNRYIWVYDDQNRIIEHSSFEDSRLIWKEVFSYSDFSYKFIRTWYDHNGQPQHLKEKSWEYWQQYTFTYKLDNEGRQIEEIVSNEKGEVTSRTTTEYNEFGMVSMTIKYNKENEPDMTHIYKYKK